jgi:hypothetical protein
MLSKIKPQLKDLRCPSITALGKRNRDSVFKLMARLLCVSEFKMQKTNKHAFL